MVAREAYNQHISNPEVGDTVNIASMTNTTSCLLQRDYVFLDVCVEGDLIGRLVLELYSHLCPRTAHNFLCLCTGDNGSPQTMGAGGQDNGTDEGGPRLSYVNSLIHRIVAGGWIQGGGSGSTHTAVSLTNFLIHCRYMWREWQWRHVHLWKNI